MTKTYSAKPSQVTRNWYLIDAKDIPLGRLSTLAATYLMGKHKPMYTSHIDCGDGVVVMNAAKLKLTGRKMELKTYYRHSGYPGNLKAVTAGEIMNQDPTKLVIMSVSGMLPKNKLQPARLARLKVYAGAEHEQMPQQPVTLEVK